MIKCRICFKTSEDIKMTPFNDQYLSYFNLLTNLKIQLCDVTCQHLCENCIEMINLFVEFRNKCILATCVLQNNYIFEEDIKQEDTEEKSDDMIDQKIRVKIDKNHESDSEDDNIQDLYIDTDDQFVNRVLEQDVKHITNEIVKVYTKKQKKENILTTSFSCGLCSKTFDDRNAMSNHLDSHKNDKICLLCIEKFKDWQELLSHRLKHVLSKNKICHICFKPFKTPLYLEHHYRNSHTANEKILLRCLQCNRTSRTPKLLQKHIWSCHTDKKFICDFCSKVCKTKQQLKIHMAVHMDCKPFACDICEFSCKFFSNLKNHKMWKHTPERVYCQKCNRVFGSRLLRDKHKCLDKLVVCATCGKTFYGKGRLTRHMHSHTATAHFRCERCPAAFKSADALRAHRDRHDGLPSKQCEYCPKRFYTGSVLIKHRRTHTGIKPYVCRICKKAFITNTNLKVHMRVHGEYLITKKGQNDVESLNSKGTVWKGKSLNK